MYRYVTEPILIGFDAQKADKLEGSGRDNPGKDSPPTNPTPTIPSALMASYSVVGDNWW